MLETKRILQNMPPEDLDKLATQIDRLHSMLGIARIIGAACVAIAAGLISVVIWVNTTTTNLAAAQRDLRSMASDRAETLKEWGAWRVKKDETDTRTIQILENQSRMIERQQTILDRVTLRN